MYLNLSESNTTYINSTFRTRYAYQHSEDLLGFNHIAFLKTLEKNCKNSFYIYFACLSIGVCLFVSNKRQNG